MSDLGNKTRLCSEMVVLRGGLQNKERAMEVRNKKKGRRVQYHLGTVKMLYKRFA